jgi:hypothetical protein
MIARAKPRRRKSRTRKNTEQFLLMLPLIHEQARHAFRSERPERREDLIAEVIANCWATFMPLMNRGLNDVSYAMLLGEVSSFCAAKFWRQMRQKKMRTLNTI